MSLDYGLEKIEDWESYCWTQAHDDPEKVRMNSDTEILIWASLAVDLGAITKTNWPEWMFRLNVLNRVHRPVGTKRDRDGKNVPYAPDMWTIKRHIGLWTNVTNVPRGRWLNKVKHNLEREMQEKTNHQQEEEK